MERFVPDMDAILDARRDAQSMRSRYIMACTDIGEPPLKDVSSKIPLWVSILLRGYALPKTADEAIDNADAFITNWTMVSSVQIATEHPVLRCIGDERELTARIEGYLVGVRSKLSHMEEMFLKMPEKSGH